MSGATEMWANKCHELLIENERLRVTLAVALSEHDTNEGQLAEGYMPKHWTHTARRLLNVNQQQPADKMDALAAGKMVTWTKDG